MSYEKLKGRLDDGSVVILDGATGTELQRRGVDMDPAAWCGVATLENDRLLSEIHRDYIAVGAEVITANTFASSRLMLSPAGYGDQVEEINRRAVEAALSARDATPGGKAVVAGSLSHMIPIAEGTDKSDLRTIPSDAALSDAFHELAGILKASGVELIILEMMYHPVRAKLALEAAQDTGLPIWFGLSARRNDQGEAISFYHVDDLPLSAVTRLLPGAGLDAAGCMHSGADLIAAAQAETRKAFDGALMAYPDGGYFEMPDWRFVDVIDPGRMEDFFLDWLKQGTQIIGACCGLTVEHIQAAVRARDRFLDGL
ncbi:homocysteine S-methyltransferase family protein [Pelagibius sp.]|uniref:homocysteine S-methyltransferase family protein n=1 Tax=Pelagibius sp. TaxID=1931238 RepID=UPI003B503953